MLAWDNRTDIGTYKHIVASALHSLQYSGIKIKLLQVHIVNSSIY